MEIVEAEALKPSLRTESVFSQTISEEILCLNANNVVVGEDFSVDDLLDFSNGEFQHGSVGKEIYNYEEEEEEHEKNSTTSGSEHDRTEDDGNSNSIMFSGNGESDSIFAGELAVPADDVADLEWVSHFVDDSLPELSLLCPVQARVEPEPRPGPSPSPTKATSHLTLIRRKPRTNKTRRPNCNMWSFNPILCRAKKQRKKPEAQTGGAQVQRRCSHCQVQKTPQWRTGPLGPKTLCNACGVRYKSGRLFPEYRPASSPTFSGNIHSNSHRKVLEMRRRKETETEESVSGLNRNQMASSW
ncbi:GATA transcription factor 7 [Lathyrus oleraceus]|uniref:GATA transcription factor n=1 Tax=Pisum sativum TaxID=3888 RepID=A0A9D4VRN4_PEA|nr:GATA transcription factor 7-like [Pisum sativum]XP_050894592.1 GATA transcription factor 7-like [Pisum sativum]KAI5388406.1 hypothetical protein KIW84_074196 [Pisum sativum]